MFVHGLGVSSTYFWPLAEQLSAQMCLIARTCRGWGRSDRPDVVLDVAAAADVLAQIIVAEDLGRCALVANSLGCQFAVELADRRADLVAGLVLISPTVDPRFRSPAREGLSLGVDWAREPAGLWPIVARDYWRMGPRDCWRRRCLHLAIGLRRSCRGLKCLFLCCAATETQPPVAVGPNVARA